VVTTQIQSSGEDLSIGSSHQPRNKTVRCCLIVDSSALQAGLIVDVALRAGCGPPTSTNNLLTDQPKTTHHAETKRLDTTDHWWPAMLGLPLRLPVTSRVLAAGCFTPVN